MDALRDELRRLDRSPRALRHFGVLVGGVFVAVACWAAWRLAGAAPGWAVAVGAVGAGLVGLGLVAPRALGRPYVAWMALAVALGYVTSRVLLTAVFVLIVTPIGLALRALGRPPLALRPDSEAGTYWHPRPPADPARFERYY